MEDSSALRFGDDFAETQMLLNTEVAIILKQLMDGRRDKGQPVGEHMRNMLEHVQRFDLMKGDRERVQNVRIAETTNAFDALHQFELVQIVNLGCREVDEAKTLIPSLREKIEHGSADSLLDDDRLRDVIETCARQHTFEEAIV